MGFDMEKEDEIKGRGGRRKEERTRLLSHITVRMERKSTPVITVASSE